MVTRFLRSWPPGIRTQLALWYTAVFTVLIVLFGVLFYVNLRATLASSLDSTLQLRTQQIASGVADDQGTITIADVTGELPGLNSGTPVADTGDPEAIDQHETEQFPPRANVDIGTLVRILDAHGKVVYISPAFRSLTVPSASFTQPLAGTAWQGTVSAHDGKQVRLYSVPLSDHGHIYGVVQVGEPLAPLTSTLRSVVIGWLVLAPFVLLVSAAGSYWLARRAFQPIHRLTRTAREIEAEDLHRRVPIPAAQDEVQDLALTLNEMIERLDEAFTRQRRFVADASHELRTPVAAIRSMTDVAIAQPASAEELSAVLRDVNAEADRLGHLITDLLALARADEGQAPLDHEPVRLDQLATDVAGVAEPLAAERGVALVVRADESVTVLGDEARLIQAVMNLVDNAITYTGAGGNVTLTVTASGQDAVLTVQDTGIGIAPEHLPHIFERFYRADAARTRANGGSGLGLSIVDWVVRAHDGTIDASSEPGKGSTFTMTLPLAVPDDEPA